MGVSQPPSLRTLALVEVLGDGATTETAKNLLDLGVVNEDALKDVLHDSYRSKSNKPAEMARQAVCIFSYSEGGAPIRKYLQDYGPLESTTTCDRSITPSSAMLEEMAAWLGKKISPPVVFMMEKYSGMTAMILRFVGDRDLYYTYIWEIPGEHAMWRLPAFWIEVIGGFDYPALEAVVTCILSMRLDRAQVSSILGPTALDNFPPEMNEIMPLIRVSEHEERLDAFEPYGKLPKGQRLPSSIIEEVLGDYNAHLRNHIKIGRYQFTEDQMAELKEVTFLHSKPEGFTPIHIFAKDYLAHVKERFSKLKPEDRLNVRLLSLLADTPEGLEGLRKGIFKGDISYFIKKSAGIPSSKSKTVL
ncbi:hypothetical protein FRB93_004788 [Tulasnella sp. JGI-2019a]|nr:hypothetical protein FRB93_004788 [Tulasnella sp. JGI-2019a]